MKDLKHQLLEQLDDSDIVEEFKRRKLKPPGSDQQGQKLNQYKLNLLIQLILLAATLIFIFLIQTST